MIELIIVILILGLLTSLVAPEMFSKVSSSQRKTASMQMLSFETALDTYRLDIGRYPESLSELRQSENPRWDGPYLPKDLPMDPWGNPYAYKAPGTEGKAYDLMSYGADGKPGGEDDNQDILHN